jgi:hypothetical protein
MSRVRHIQPILRATALAAALTVSHLAAQAQTTTLMQATGSYQLDNKARVDLLDQLPNDPVDVLAFPNLAAFESRTNAGLHSYGSTTGNFGSRSSGEGRYDVTGSFKIVQSITNTGLTAANATFNFYITPGMLANYIGSVPLTGAEFVKSGISFDVQRNGAGVWGSSALLQTNSFGSSFSALGDTSLYVGSDRQYVINGVSKSVDLGVVNAGETISLSYELKTFAQGQSQSGGERVVPGYTYVVPAHWINVTCDGYGSPTSAYGECIPGPLFVPEETVTVPGYTVFDRPSGSHANAGDPFTIDFEGQPVFTTNGILPPGTTVGVVFAPVPEPGTWALMLGGMGLVGFMARRRKPVSA